MGSRAVLRAERRMLSAIVVCGLLGSGAEAGFLVLVARTGVALGEGDAAVVLYGDTDLAIGTALILAAAFLGLRFLANIAGAALTSASLARAAVRMRTELTVGYLDASWAIKHGMAPGRAQQLLSGYTNTAVTVVTAASRGFTAVVGLIALISVALVIQPVITLAAGGLVASLGTLMLPLRRMVKNQAQAAAAAQLHYATTVNETESLALEIEVLGVSHAAGARVGVAAKDAAHSLGRSQFAQLAIGPAYQVIAYTAVLGFLAVATSTGLDDIATVGAVIVLLLRSLGYGQSLQVARAQFTNADVYATALHEELLRYRDSTPEPGSQTAEIASGVSAERLSFSYDQQPALHDLDFRIDPGEIVGVVGPSGSGKSTLTQLLLGLRPSDGRLRIDDVTVDLAEPEWWSRHVALVPQHCELLTGTVAENVRFLRDEISDAEVEAACRRAGVHDEVMALSDGYATHLGERGGRLSGGQRQRLCIARALAGRPRFLVLDEPTSALDGAAERRVLESLRDLQDTTIVIVTHRPAALGICDRVLGLEGGRIDYFGPVADYSGVAG